MHAPATPPAVLPEPLARWAIQLLGAEAPTERHATCSDCPMCTRGAADGLPRSIYFAPDTRCCTYRPYLPNFAVGALLSSTDPTLEHGRESVRQRIAEGEGLPVGVVVNARDGLIYEHAREASFGRSPALRCPHLASEGRCGIWAFRPAVCATWFCKHERGALGARFWNKLLLALSAAEHAVSIWCIAECGLGDAAEEALHARERDGDGLAPTALERRRDPERDRRVWRDWLGREEAFYRDCAELVAGLEWPDVERIGGAELRVLAAAARRAGREHGDLALPARVQAGSFGVLGARGGRLWLSTYSGFDPLQVAPDVLSLVARCDGRGLEAIRTEHETLAGGRPPLALVRLLLDFGVLEAAPDEGEQGCPDACPVGKGARDSVSPNGLG